MVTKPVSRQRNSRDCPRRFCRLKLVTAIRAGSSSSTHGGTVGAKTPQVEHDAKAPLLLIAFWAAGRQRDFPELRIFPRSFAPFPETGGIPPESALFYEELRATAGSCRELILKREIRGKFSIFFVSLPPPFMWGLWFSLIVGGLG